MKLKYEVQQRFMGEWENVWGKYFDNYREANLSIEIYVYEKVGEMRAGLINDAPKISDFRVAEVLL